MRRLSLRDDKSATASAVAQSVKPRLFSSCSTRDKVQLRSLGLPLATVLLGSLLSGSDAMAAQSLPAANVSAPTPRVLGDWRSSASVAIAHSKPSFNPAAIDLGPAPANQTLSRMLLLLAPSPAQQQALAAELAGLQNSSSPNYHQWLTPQAFAHSYANNASDVAAVAAWLESQGFTVAPLPAGLGWIEFSGTVAQVEQAFGAQVHLGLDRRQHARRAQHRHHGSRRSVAGHRGTGFA